MCYIFCPSFLTYQRKERKTFKRINMIDNLKKIFIKKQVMCIFVISLFKLLKVSILFAAALKPVFKLQNAS